jgi:hypothetical protein
MEVVRGDSGLARCSVGVAGECFGMFHARGDGNERIDSDAAGRLFAQKWCKTGSCRGIIRQYCVVNSFTESEPISWSFFRLMERFEEVDDKDSTDGDTNYTSWENTRLSSTD